jgi:ATP-binding cassette subfamily B (MDR/TAP) protein 1
MNEVSYENSKIYFSSFRVFFCTAEITDKVLMAIGTVGCICFGACVPILHLLIGKVINEIYDKDSSKLQSNVNDLCVIFCYVGIVAVLSGILQVACWTYAGELQCQRLQDRYIRSIFSQDLNWFENIVDKNFKNNFIDVVKTVRGNDSLQLIQFIDEKTS